MRELLVKAKALFMPSISHLPERTSLLGNTPIVKSTLYSQKDFVSHPPLAQAIEGAPCHNCLLPVQAKRTINKPGDRYEQEADRIADQVMRMPESRVQRQVKDEDEDDEETIQIKPLAGQITHMLQRQVEPEDEEDEEPIQAKGYSEHTRVVSQNMQTHINALRTGGLPLPSSLRAFFEPRFGYDFSQIRVHYDSQAIKIARSINAHAFTTGKDIVFGARQYSPGTNAGKRLLAHELTHVIQQASSSSNNEFSKNSLENKTNCNREFSSYLHRPPIRMIRNSPQIQRQEEEPHGAGGWLDITVLDPLQKGYDSWINWGWNLSSRWGERVPIAGHFGGAVVGFIPWMLGSAGKIIVAVPQFVIPKTREEHFMTVMTVGTYTPSVRIIGGMRYGYWFVKNALKKKPTLEQEIARQGPKVMDKVLKMADKIAPERIKQVIAIPETKTKMAQKITPSKRYIRVPTTGTKGSQIRSVKGRASKSIGGPRGPKKPELTSQQQEFMKKLKEEHSSYKEKFLISATKDAKAVKGRGVAGSDVVTKGNKLREIFAIDETVSTWQSIWSKLAKKKQRPESHQIYVQLTNPGIRKDTLKRWADQAKARGEEGMQGKILRIHGPNGELWWEGKFPGTYGNQQ